MDAQTSNPSVLSDIESELVARATDPDFNPRAIIKSYGNKLQSMEEYNQLLEMGDELKNPLKSSKMKRLKSYADDMIIISDVLGKRDLEQEAKLKSDTTKLLVEGIKKNIPRRPINGADRATASSAKLNR